LTINGAGTISSVTVTSANGNLIITGPAGLTTNITGDVSMTDSTGNNYCYITRGNVGGDINMTSDAAVGWGNDLHLDGSTAGSITCSGTGSSMVVLNGTSSVAGDVTTGSGGDLLGIYAGGAINGTVNLGGGTNSIFINEDATYTFSAINTGADAGSITIDTGSVSSAQYLLITDGLGSSASTITVTGNIDSLTFNTADTTVAGTLVTAAVGTGNVLDASAIANGGTLLDASGLTAWDVLDDGVEHMNITGNLAFADGNSVTLADGYDVDLIAWQTGGVNNIDLTVGGASISLTWDVASSRYESGLGVTGDWAIETITDVGTGKDELTLTKLA
jgi:hypothetical protein